jgi:Ser/Thr protein kinase RdoA (MazF antagonist)
MGQVTEALRNFDHQHFIATFTGTLPSGLVIIQKYEPLIENLNCADLSSSCALFEQHTALLLPGLRRSVTHNDANDFNLLAGGGEDLYSRNQNIVGLIDFGDMVYSYAISDLAVAIAYAILDNPDPLAVAAQIVKGYHAACPITEDELAALFGLVTMRLCMSACIAADQQSRQPGNEYLGIVSPFSHITKTCSRSSKLCPSSVSR